MADAPPVLMDWDGEAFIPANQFWVRKCDEHFVVGEQYKLVEHHDRSMRSHRFYFASINEAHKNLPDDLAERFATPDALRKYALIRAGYRDERTFVASSKAEALRLASFVRPMDEYAVVAVRDSVVTVYTAKSQSVRAMGRDEFRASLDKVLDIVAGMIGTSKDTLAANADRAA